MAFSIAILEDNRERRVAMKRWLRDRFAPYERRFFNDPRNMNLWLQEHYRETLAVSLDHDLNELPPDPRATKGKLGAPGDLTGMDVASFLCLLPPSFPVLVHSSNAPAAAEMARRLRDKHWRVELVAPFGDTEWIDQHWYPALRGLVIADAKNRAANPSHDPRPQDFDRIGQVLQAWTMFLRESSVPVAERIAGLEKSLACSCQEESTAWKWLLEAMLAKWKSLQVKSPTSNDLLALLQSTLESAEFRGKYQPD